MAKLLPFFLKKKILNYCLLVVSSELINEWKKKNGSALFPKDTFFFLSSQTFLNKFKQISIKIITFIISNNIIRLTIEYMVSIRNHKYY